MQLLKEALTGVTMSTSHKAIFLNVSLGSLQSQPLTHPLNPLPALKLYRITAPGSVDGVPVSFLTISAEVAGMRTEAHFHWQWQESAN